MNFYTSYFANVKNLPESFIPISIAAKTPDGFKGFKLGDFKPKYEFFQKWKETGDDDYYVEHYKKEVLDKINLPSLIRSLEMLVKNYNLSKNATFVFICYERPEKFCHRHLVAEFLTKNGYDCTEYE